MAEDKNVNRGINNKQNKKVIASLNTIMMGTAGTVSKHLKHGTDLLNPHA